MIPVPDLPPTVTPATLARSGTSLLDRVPDSALAALAASCRVRQLGAGEVLCRSGDVAGSLFVLQRGLLHAVGPDGALLGRQRPGDVLGELAVLTGERRSATLVARLSSEVLEVERAGFLRVAEAFPVLFANLARGLSRRMLLRTAAPGSTGRAELTAVVVGTGPLPPAQVLTAVRTASAEPVHAVDLTSWPRPTEGRALDLVETASRHPGLRLLLVRPDDPGLPVLLDYADRVVALTSTAEADGLRQRCALPPGRLEVAPPDTGRLPRLGRLLARTRLGLALGAGGVKGFAHVGALRVLEGAGYSVDGLAGSSAGAWIGAWAACGRTAADVEDVLRRSFDRDAVGAMYREGAVAGARRGAACMDRLARGTTDEATFDQLDLPLVVLAADLASRSPVALDRGPVHEALVAAMTVPGLYPPVERDGRRLVDAVVVSPVPTPALDGLPVDLTVAVNLLGRQGLPRWPGHPAGRSDRRTERQGERDVVVESLELASAGVAELQTARADVPVTPLFGPGTWRSVDLADEYLRAGEAAMRAALPALRARAGPT